MKNNAVSPRSPLPALALAGLLALALAAVSCSRTEEPAAAVEGGMTVAELKAMPKVDAHAHIFGARAADQFTPQDIQAEQTKPLQPALEAHNMRWFDICTGGLKWEELKEQHEVASLLYPQNRERFPWATSFNLTNWGAPDWQDQALRTIEDGFMKGAVAVKVWKEIGMELKDPDSSFVMIDDPRFDPIFDYVAAQGKTVVAHIGEPRNCWLPLDSMTVNNDRAYFAEYPQYHCYLHPEIPHYWKHVAARDSVLAHHPDLRLVGCHLGSLEFDVDELARRFDLYPNFAVDLAARICHFQVQDRDKVRAFIIKYQDRLLYGTDAQARYVFESEELVTPAERLERTYENDYRYFATDEELTVPEVNGPFQGLALPREVLEKIFYKNFYVWYPGA